MAHGIQSRRNKIFLLMEEVRRLRIQQRIKVGPCSLLWCCKFADCFIGRPPYWFFLGTSLSSAMLSCNRPQASPPRPQTSDQDQVSDLLPEINQIQRIKLKFCILTAVCISDSDNLCQIVGGSHSYIWKSPIAGEDRCTRAKQAQMTSDCLSIFLNWKNVFSGHLPSLEHNANEWLRLMAGPFAHWVTYVTVMGALLEVCKDILWFQNGVKSREAEVKDEQYPPAVPLLPARTDATLNDYWRFYLTSVSAIILFGGLLSPILKVKMGLGGMYLPSTPRLVTLV